MAREWLITSRGIAKKVKNNTCLSSYQIKEVGAEANRECPNCKYLIDNSDVTLDWPGLPAGVKFDPSDIELLEHLAAKIGLENSKPHTLIDEFIPMLDVEEGICYTHPQNLPGAQKDGSSIHFFHRISNAYGIGQRKRRKISQSSLLEENVRWHKTGKTKPVLESGVQKGWKKIMVLYRSTKRGSKPDKANWVMHQYHIGSEEDEMEGQLVVSKIFYQQLTTQFDKSEMDCTNEESERLAARVLAARVGPRTPKPNAPQPPRMKEDSPNEACGLYLPHLLDKENCNPISEVPPTPIPLNQLKSTKGEDLAWWAGESQAVVEPEPGSNFHESLLCQELLDSFPNIDFSNINSNRNEIINDEISNTASRFPDLDDIIVDTPPDFELADLEFGSQESSMSWLDHI